MKNKILKIIANIVVIPNLPIITIMTIWYSYLMIKTLPRNELQEIAYNDDRSYDEDMQNYIELHWSFTSQVIFAILVYTLIIFYIV